MGSLLPARRAGKNGGRVEGEEEERVKDFPIVRARLDLAGRPDRSAEPPSFSLSLLPLKSTYLAGRELRHRRRTCGTCRRSSYLNYAIQALSVISVLLKIK